mmetsp:Transcript_39889/g.116406  ORF Transcript_39889/g.116406 Transcript_39889/m.116406 type:complete len:219 (-) Transcript_39889:144-800(-)|eukprot:6408307-Prymnesium_polylepis.1
MITAGPARREARVDAAVALADPPSAELSARMATEAVQTVQPSHVRRPTRVLLPSSRPRTIICSGTSHVDGAEQDFGSECLHPHNTPHRHEVVNKPDYGELCGCREHLPGLRRGRGRRWRRGRRRCVRPVLLLPPQAGTPLDGTIKEESGREQCDELEARGSNEQWRQGRSGQSVGQSEDDRVCAIQRCGAKERETRCSQFLRCRRVRECVCAVGASHQ